MSVNVQPHEDARPGGLAFTASSLVRIAVFYTFSGLFLPLVILVAALRPGRSTYYPMARAWARAGLRIFRIRVEERGLEKLVAGRDYVILANHRSHFDPLAIVATLDDRETRWVAKKELLKVPIFGFALRVTGQILIDRADHQQSIEALRRHLRTGGASVVFFPEGHRAPTTELLAFKKGGAAFAIDAGLPVVPVAVSGSERILRTQTLLVRPGTIRVSIGDPIEVGTLDSDDRESLTRRVRDAIEGMLGELEPRGSAAPVVPMNG